MPGSEYSRALPCMDVIVLPEHRFGIRLMEKWFFRNNRLCDFASLLSCAWTEKSDNHSMDTIQVNGEDMDLG